MRNFFTLLIFSAVTFGIGLQSLAQCTSANRHYPLESPSGTEIINGINGTYTNTIGGSNTVAEDRFEEDDKSLWLFFENGNNLDVPWINTSQASISIWVSPNSYSGLRILMRGSSLSNAVHLCVQPTTKILGMLDPSGTFIPSSFSFPGGMGHESWRHIVFEADGAVNRIYVDGVMVLQNTSGYNLTVDPVARFLNDIPSSVNRGYVGGVNNIKVYDRLLSSDEIQFVRGFQTYPNAHYTRDPSCFGDLVELTAPMFNAPNGTTYQWFKDGVAISGATGDTYTFSSNFTNGGVYTVDAYFDCLTETNRAFVVSPAAEIAPSKNNDLTDAEFCENGFGMLEFDVSGLDNSYQWYFNGSPVTGDKPQITFNPALPFQEGEWYVEASNACGSTTSSTAFVTINLPTSQEVTLHPVNTTACSGSVVTLTGEFNYADSYQWYFITPFPSQNIVLTGETNNNLTFNPLQPSDNGTYVLVASDGNGCELATNPGFVGSSGGLKHRYPIENGTALDVIGNNDGNPIGQLSDANRFGTANSSFFQDNVNGKLVDIDDITSPNITVSMWFKYGTSSPGNGTLSILMSPDDAGPVQVCISNGVSVGQLGIYNNNQFISSGVSISKTNTLWRHLVYTSNNGVTRLYLNGALILEETTANIDPAITPISRFLNGWSPNVGQGLWGSLDDVHIFDGLASQHEAQLLQGFSSGPQNLVANCTGENLSFTPTHHHFNASTPNVTFHWYKDGIPVSGLTTMALDLPNVQASDAGVYVLRVNSGCFYVESEPVTVTVDGETPQITLGPVNQTICEGQTLTLNAGATGSGLLSYSWRQNGTHVTGGINMTTYSIPNATAANSGAWTVQVSNNCGVVESNPATIIVGTPATITTQPLSQNLCTGQSFTVSVGTSGDVVSYQWQKDGTPITGADAASFTIPSLVLSDAGSYVCVMEDACGNTLTTTAAALTTSEGINVSFQPDGGTVCEGTNFTLAVGASNVSSYQWLFNGSPISGATSSSYTGTNATGANAGDYTVEMTNSCGTISSSIATVDVELLPTISNTLSNQSICVGDALSFAISAAGSNLEYQWQKDGSAIPGEESASLTLSSVGLAEGGSYSVNVFNGCGNVTSNVATVTVTEPIAITNAPTSAVVCAGDNHTFSVTASGTNPSYNWTLNGNTWSTGSTLTFSNVQTSNAGNYVVAVSNSCGTETAAPVSLTVNEAPVIATHPFTNQTICSGDALNLSVVSVSSGLSYQWKKDGVDIPGATSMNFAIGSTETTDSGIYTVEITNNCGAVTSNNAEILVIQQTIIQSQPAPSSVCINDNYTFTVSAIGNGLSYQWQKDGVNLPGETGTSLVISNAQIADNGNYTVIVTGTCGTVTSSVANFTVTGGASIIDQPQDIAVCINQSGTLEVNATGPGLSYQWSFEGNPIAGATGSSYTIPSASSANEGAYTVTVTGSCGGPVQSSVANVTLNTQPVYASIPDPAAYCEGDQVTLTATFSNDVTSVQWFKNGDFLTSNALGTLELNPIALSDAGNYVMNAFNGCGSLASPAFAIAVNPTFVTNLQESVCFGETVEMGGNTYDQTGNFSVLLQTIEGCDSTVNLDLTVLPEVTNTLAASICLGDSYTFDGQSFTTSGTYTATFTSVNSGCDSTVTLNLSVIDSSVPFNQTASVCFGETYTFGAQTLSQSGNYTEIFQSTAGCDSTVNLVFTVENEIIPVVITNEATATVEAISGASYQWVDCDNGNAPIAGETSTTFTASSNGNYAVVVTLNNCEATSACVLLQESNVGIKDWMVDQIEVYPNPARNNVNMRNLPLNTGVVFTNALGQEVLRLTTTAVSHTVDVSSLYNGVYFIHFTSDSGAMHLVKLVLNK